MAVAALLTLASVSMASAAITVVKVTGSTAYRVADVSAEVAYLGTSSKAVWFDSSTGSLNHANYSIVYGPTGSNQVVFENLFNGSIAGDEALVAPVSLAFPDSSNTSYINEATLTVAPAANTNSAAKGGTYDGHSSPVLTHLATPDVAFSDVFFDTAQQIIGASSYASAVNNTPDNDITVGIVPFVFVASGTTDVTSKLSGLSMDPQKATFLWQNGYASLALFTGSSADETTRVYAFGRDADSGTRATALGETGLGLLGSSQVTGSIIQYYAYNNATSYSADFHAGGFSATTGVVGDDSNASSVGYINFVPNEAVDGYAMTGSDGGYYSGGNLATAVKLLPSSGLSKTAIMTYLGVSDAAGILSTSGVNLLNYNGSTFNPAASAFSTSPNQEQIYEGKYTFWGYEHAFYFNADANASTINGLVTSIAGSLDVLSSNGVTTTAMKVNRADDGQNVQPLYSNY